MDIDGKTVLVCNCEKTMPLDGQKLARACGAVSAPAVATQLCRAEVARFDKALASGTSLIVACTQESPLFDERREEAGSEIDIRYVNIRERAGWSAEAADAHPKIAALLAEAALDLPSTTTVTMRSEGVALIYGRDESAIAAARRLMDKLNVTVILSKPGDVAPPRLNDVPVVKGTIVKSAGHLGAFDITVDDFAAPLPSSRASLIWGPAQNGSKSRCDVILDLTGGTPLFPAHTKRDGYLRPDPGDAGAVERAIFDIGELVGEFEKPRYVDYKAEICAHSRSRKTGCTRCLDVCPTGAIRSIGEAVAFDPYICAGCGSCASVCPTGAAGYTLPPAETLVLRARTLIDTYLRAGGSEPVVFAYDVAHGDELIDAMARSGRGLPARVLPFAVNEVTQLGFEFFVSCLAYGASDVRVLATSHKRGELAGLAQQLGLAETALSGLGYGEGRVGLIEADDPDVVEAALYDLARRAGPKPGTFLPLGAKRGLATLALGHLHDVAPAPVDILPLPAGAPFGALQINADGCTLCLSCVPACPTGALGDNPDRPTLTFNEQACVQCGLCRATCPEKVIQLQPRFNFTADARAPVIVKTEEPFHCIKCGKPFGTKSTVERIIEKLGKRHWMFADDTAVNRIRMCGDCRLIDVSSAKEPFAGTPRPVVRTTEDYLAERAAAEAADKPDKIN